MQELQIVEGNQHRDFADIVWQITERGCCNEFVVRYDCGHSLRAEVCVPAIPSTKEYGSHPTERRRYAQHALHVLTRNPASLQAQVTVLEGRCRHCQRGQRQTLVCGPVHIDLREPASPGLVVKALGDITVDVLAQAKRMELAMTGQNFLTTVCQVLPDGAEILPPSGAKEAVFETPFASLDAPVNLKEELHTWLRKEVEDELESLLLRYVCCATMILMLLCCECFYLFTVPWMPQDETGGEESEDVQSQMALALANLTSVSSLELQMTNSTWMLSALTLAVHKALGPPESPDGTAASESAESDGRHGGSGGFLWSVVVHPLWVFTLCLLRPLSGLESLVLLPRSMILAFLTSVRELVLRPGAFLLGILFSMLLFLLQSLFSPPTLFASAGSANPILGAAFIVISLAAITSPVPLTLLAHDLCALVANLDLVRRLRRAAGHKALGRLLDRLHLSPLGSASRGSKGQRSKKDYKPPRSESGRGDKLQGKDEKGGVPFVPSCFVCLDKPSRYILEPCGHRVVCGDCAVQLVDAAARSRPTEERGGDRGGNCPSCGQSVNRAMRIFI